MQNTLRHIIVWFLTANLLVSTMGLTVHSLYCICKDSLSISVFEIDSRCGQPLSDDLPSCCKATLEASTCSKDHDCEDKDSKYVKLASQFVVNEMNLELQVPDLQEVAVLRIIIDDEVLATHTGGQYYNKPPPILPFGKSLLPHIQSFLC